MEKIDRRMETQVWQRVRQEQTPNREDLRPLLLLAWESAVVYQHVLTLLQGKQKERMKGLSEQAMRSVEALKGIQAMTGQPAGKLRPQPIPKEPARRLLEKSFYRAGRLMTEYTARALDPEFGVVYQILADRERETSAVLAELVGGLER